MGRIESNNINYGNSFVVSPESSRHSDDELKQAKQIAENVLAQAKEKALIVEGEASTKAQQIIDEAVAKANAQVEEITQAAREKGYEAGYKDGFEKITTEMEDKLINLNNFAKSEFDMKKRIIKSMHADILELIVSIAKKVCSDEFKQNPELLEKLTIAAISQLKEKENITIIVNPMMAEKIYNVSDKLKSAVKTLDSIKITEDNSVSPDGTIVETVGSRVDSRLCAQIDKIAQELYNELNSTSEEELMEEAEKL